MIFEYNPTDLAALCALASNDRAEIQRLILRLGLLNLSDTEESLLGQLYPPDPKKIGAALDKYDLIIRAIRGENVDHPWLNPNQISNLQLTKELLQSGQFVATLTRSLYLWIIDNNYRAVLQFLHRLNKFTGGDFYFSKRLDLDWPLFYTNVSVLLMAQFFEHIPEGYQFLFIESGLLIVALRNGLDIDSALRRSVDDLYAIENRHELSLEYATFIYRNPSIIGKKFDKPSEPATIAYWVDTFGKFTNHKWNLDAIDKFIADKNILSNCSDEDVNVIVQIITTYTHAITKNYVLPDIPPEELKKLVAEEAKKRLPEQARVSEPVSLTQPESTRVPAPAPTTTTPAPQPIQIAEPIWKNLLAGKAMPSYPTVEAWLKAQTISSDAKKKVQAGLAGVEWRDEPALGIMLVWSGLFERRFGERQALIYFDQTTGAFEWNI